MIVEIEKNTIRHLFERAIKEHSNLPSVAFSGGRPLSYEELGVRVMGLGADLCRAHIQAGDRVAILGDNSPNWVIAYLAVTTIGAVAVPILPGFPDSDIRHILRDSECKAAFIDDKKRSVLDDPSGNKLAVVYSLEDFSMTRLKPSFSDYIENLLLQIKDRVKGEPADEDIYRAIKGPEPEDLAAIIYTSGTTGHSKGVMLTHNNIASDVVNGIEKFPIDSNDRFLSILPLSHTFEATGGMLCPLSAGVSIYYMKGLPTPQKLIGAMQTVRPTGVLTVPLVMDKIYRKRILPKFENSPVLRRLYSRPWFRKRLNKTAGRKLVQSLGGRLRFFMFGGAALNPDVELFLQEAGISYSTGYGMTETSPIITINPFGQVRVGSCGQPIPGIEMKIHQPDPETGVGEICVKGPIVMKGYYHNQEATDEVFLEDEWLRTGDLGIFDEEGYLFIRGRSKNVIVGPNGENIYPEIIEQKLMQTPCIQECVVFQHQEQLIAKVYLDQDQIDERISAEHTAAEDQNRLMQTIVEEARQAVNAQFPAFSKIQKMEIYPEPFEKTPTNKVKRYLYIPSSDE